MQPTPARARQACNASSHTRKLELRLFFHTNSLLFLFFFKSELIFFSYGYHICLYLVRNIIISWRYLAMCSTTLR